MALGNVDFENALRRLAEKRIEDAMREGKFDNLAGAGKPIDLEPLPADENARMMWWALKLMRQNDFTPDELRYRKQIDRLKQELSTAQTEQRVIALVQAANAVIRQLNTMGTNMIKSTVYPLVLEQELESFRQRQRETRPLNAPAEITASSVQCANPQCRHASAQPARFCPRCGAALH